MKQKLTFQNSKGDNIIGILSNPSGDLDIPIIILCHGFTSEKNSPTYINLEESLNKANMATFRFDFYGHGESDGKFEDITISEAVDDALNAVKFIKNKGYKKIGLFGSSFGGITALIVASQTPELLVLALKAPVSDFHDIEIKKRGEEGIREWNERGYAYRIKSDGTKLRLNYSFFKDTKNNIAYPIASKIKIPTIIVHGDQDKNVPIQQSKKTSQIIKNCKLEIIQGADHRFTNKKDFDKCTKLISEFIIKHLK